MIRKRCQSRTADNRVYLSNREKIFLHPLVSPWNWLFHQEKSKRNQICCCLTKTAELKEKVNRLDQWKDKLVNLSWLAHFGMWFFSFFPEFIFRLWVHETNLNSSGVCIFLVCKPLQSWHSPMVRANVMTSTFTLTSLSRITHAGRLLEPLVIWGTLSRSFPRKEAAGQQGAKKKKKKNTSAFYYFAFVILIRPL